MCLIQVLQSNSNTVSKKMSTQRVGDMGGVKQLIIDTNLAMRISTVEIYITSNLPCDPG